MNKLKTHPMPSKTGLLSALHKPVLTGLQVDKLLARFTLTARFLRLLRTILEPFALAIGGYAFGIAVVAAAHYAGLDPWLESMMGR